MAAHMLSMVFALIIGFAGGYGTREWISRRRGQPRGKNIFERAKNAVLNGISTN